MTTLTTCIRSWIAWRNAIVAYQQEIQCLRNSAVRTCEVAYELRKEIETRRQELNLMPSPYPFDSPILDVIARRRLGIEQAKTPSMIPRLPCRPATETAFGSVLV
ncbi:MAG: hypothetical protein V4463_14020 [Pseudomonadota bacterium]